MTGEVPAPRYATHLCLVSQQATPNLTPVLDRAFAPARLVLVVTPDMRDRAQWLQDVVSHRTAVKVERLEVGDAWDMNGLLDQFIGWLDKQAGDMAIALNVTGGTKPMAMAAQQAFAMAGRPVFYVHQGRDEVQWLEPRLPPRGLGTLLRIEDYLQAHGWTVTDRPPADPLTPALRELARQLVLNARERQAAIGRLNGYAQECRRSQRLSAVLQPRDAGDRAFGSTLEDFERVQMCRREADTLHFPSEAARFFCNGGWLEDYVAGLLGTLAGRMGVQDFAARLKVRSLANHLAGDSGGNELDLAFLAHNRLHLVEVKTASADAVAAPALYKLDALGALGGINTRAMLVSYRELLDGERQRAKDLGIRTCVGTQLANLGDSLQQWVGTRG